MGGLTFWRTRIHLTLGYIILHHPSFFRFRPLALVCLALIDLLGKKKAVRKI